MALIWTCEALQALFQHRSEFVRTWAADRLLDLYPESEADLLAAVVRCPPILAARILSRARGPRCPASLEAFLHKSKHRLSRARAAALLIQAGHSVPAEDIAAVDWLVSDLLTATAAGFQFLLQQYRQYQDRAVGLVYGLARACACHELLQWVDAGGQDWQANLDELGNAWECDLTDLKMPHGAPELVAMLAGLLQARPVAVRSAWQQELLASLDEDRERMRTVLNAIKEAPDWSPAPGTLVSSLLGAMLLAGRRDARCREILLGAQEAGQLWRGLVLRRWQAEPGPALREFLGGLEPRPALLALREVLEQEHTFAGFPLRTLNAAAVPGRFELLLDLCQQQDDELLAGKAREALGAAGAEAAPVVLARFRADPPPVPDLFLLERMPTGEVAEFLLENFERYMSDPQSLEFITLLEDIASRRFLEPLLDEWRSGEIGIGRAIRLIAAVHEVKDGRLKRIVAEAEQKDQVIARMLEQQLSGAPGGLLEQVLQKPPGSLEVPLRCTACSRIYHYPITRIFLGEQEGPTAIGQIIQCKGCGSIETYEQTAMTHLALGAEMMRLNLLMEENKREGKASQDIPDSPVQFVRGGITARGQQFETIGDAYRFLLQESERNPQDGELQRRLGNLLKNNSRADLSQPYYLRALELDPRDAESCYHIVDNLVRHQDRIQEAIPYAETFISSLRTAPMAEGLRRHLFEELLELTVTIEVQTGYHFSLMPPIPSGLFDNTDEEAGGTFYLTNLDPNRPEDMDRLYELYLGKPVAKPRSGGLWGRVRDRFFPGRTMPAEARLPEPAEPVARKAPCPCGSGKKYKRCCGR